MGRFTEIAAIGALLLGSRAPAAVAVDRRKDAVVAGPGATVVGGEVVEPVERYPYMVPVEASDEDRSYLCGGALIHPQVVLTAAHCLPPVPDSVDVGRWDLGNTTVEGDAFDNIAVVDDAVHPGWTGVPGNEDDPDFALLLLATPSSMTPVRLVEDEGDVTVGANATAMGWGNVTSPGGPQSTQLKEAVVAIAPQDGPDACGLPPGVNVTVGDKVVVTYPAPENVLCGVGIDGYPCAGDSGGPLVIPDAGGDPAGDVLVGVISYGPAPCDAWDGISAYGKVSWARAWIEETMSGWGLTLPTDAPTEFPSTSPSTSPTYSPTGPPTTYPPTNVATTTTPPTASPSTSPSSSPTYFPTETSTYAPTTTSPSNSPTIPPTNFPTKTSTNSPTVGAKSKGKKTSKTTKTSKSEKSAKQKSSKASKKSGKSDKSGKGDKSGKDDKKRKKSGFKTNK